MFYEIQEPEVMGSYENDTFDIVNKKIISDDGSKPDAQHLPEFASPT